MHGGFTLSLNPNHKFYHFRSFVFLVFGSLSNHRAIIFSFPAISALGGSLEIVIKQKSKSG